MLFKILLVLSQLLGFVYSDDRLMLHKTTEVPGEWLHATSELNKNDPMNFKILLHQNEKGLEKLENILNDISNPHSLRYGQYLSKNSIDDMLMNSDSRDTVMDWVSGVGGVHCSDNSDNLKCSGSIENVERLFHTNIRHYVNKDSGVSFLSARHAGYSIPKTLDNSIDFVLGVVDFPQPLPTPKNHEVFDNESYIVPISIQQLYNISNRKFSKYATQSISEFQNNPCFNLDDLNNFTKDNNIPNITFPLGIHGQCNLTGLFPDVESSLDIQYQWGVNYQTRQGYTTVGDWMFEFANDLYNSENPPNVHSLSWGWSERDQCQYNMDCIIGGDSEEYTKRTSDEFMKLGLRGVTIVASSGDAGASGRTNENCDTSMPFLNPIFPAGSPWVLAAGGTIIMNASNITFDNINNVSGSIPPLCKQYNCIKGGMEINSNFDRCGWTSGGGFSNYFNRPWWQENASTSYLSSNATFPPSKYYNGDGRVYPDISAVSHNYLVRVGGDYQAVDGTSASSPAISGMISMLNNLRVSQGRPVLGLFSPLLYEMYANCSGCFKDIVVGSNAATEEGDCEYGYEATTGYDAVYGVGVPNFDKIYEYVENLKR